MCVWVCACGSPGCGTETPGETQTSIREGDFQAAFLWKEAAEWCSALSWAFLSLMKKQKVWGLLMLLKCGNQELPQLSCCRLSMRHPRLLRYPVCRDLHAVFLSLEKQARCWVISFYTVSYTDSNKHKVCRECFLCDTEYLSVSGHKWPGGGGVIQHTHTLTPTLTLPSYVCHSLLPEAKQGFSHNTQVQSQENGFSSHSTVCFFVEALWVISWTHVPFTQDDCVSET